MKQHDEDQAYEQQRQAWIDSVEGDICNPKIGTNVRFSRFANKDPWPEVPFSDESNVMPSMQLWEKVFWAILGGFFMYLLWFNPFGWSWQ